MHKDQKEEELRNAQLVEQLVTEVGGSPDTFEGELICQMIENCLKMISDKHTTGQLKLMSRAFKEIRYAYKVFTQYASSGKQMLSIFGSARTPEDHPDYLTAKAFSASMAKSGWMCITGAAHGIMKAGHEGTNKESSFGLSIKLAFESTINPLIEGDPKLINFRYFFARKLMFMSHSDAVAVFPGGFGTLDELYEILTLMQTGKSSLIPVVMLEGEGGSYWADWYRYFKEQLFANGWVGTEDEHFFYIAKSIEDATAHIEKFYLRYHSMRFVGDDLVIRIKSSLNSNQIDILNKRFFKLIKSGEIWQGEAFPEEDEFQTFPRLIFHFNRKDFGLLRLLIDQINEFP